MYLKGVSCREKERSIKIGYCHFCTDNRFKLSLAQTEISKQAIAKAQTAITKIKKACAADIRSFCSKVTLGEGRITLCMLAHEDQLSDGCFTTVFDVADNIDLAISNLSRAADVCEEEIDKHCANIETGEGRIAQCLIDKK